MCTSVVVLLEPENMGIPVEFCCYHVYNLRYVYLSLESRHLGFATSAHLLTCYYDQFNTG